MMIELLRRYCTNNRTDGQKDTRTEGRKAIGELKVDRDELITFRERIKRNRSKKSHKIQLIGSHHPP